ncbi:putative metallo-hydrolase yycJ [[Clostridium] ultunense Esp]|uniref:Putative hydrolase n=1 Tax=[Clostridium] ultunense Esp TaxID=1288971 RepID=M1ZJ66_9FIRM|nr:MBL fold metallo-hydrolase [Schnuerera ultunensis]CCQ94042.1 putative metallo-hydrolase yycJ [[Clostridium] ultunense Esp]SHD78071.1 putative hydrolase [[Clostridium] ultunense Esp]
MGIKFCSLSSGSSGNCQYIETDRVKILIDGGLSGKKIERLLSSIDVCPTTIDSILVTHEHIDHIRGVGVLSRRYDIPIYANQSTWTRMERAVGEIKAKNIKIIESNEDFQLGDLDIHSFKVFHDAAEPVGYCIYHKNIKISIITDTGWVNDNMKSIIKGSSLYLMESNHDVKMLKEGNYPWYLKKRILSTKGHLSNFDAGKTLSEVLTGNGEIVLLAHLSKENNRPSIAHETVRECMEDYGINVHRDIALDLTYRDRPTRVYTL